MENDKMCIFKCFLKVIIAKYHCIIFSKFISLILFIYSILYYKKHICRIEIVNEKNKGLNLSEWCNSSSGVSAQIKTPKGKKNYRVNAKSIKK